MHVNYLSTLCHTIRTNAKNNCTTLTTLFSKKTLNLLSVLLKEGFIRGYFVDVKKDKKVIIVLLKLTTNKHFFAQLKQNSMLKHNFYLSNSKVKKQFGGFNISVLSTKKGVMSNIDAGNLKLGGITLIDII